MKISKNQIDTFLSSKKLAIVGVSRNPSKFSHVLYKDLKTKGYQLIPVNPQAENIDGDNCYPTVNDLPNHVKYMLIITPKKETDAVLREAINKGITNIWVQQMSETAETIRIAEEYNVELIYKKCIYMFAEPVAGFHKFHKTLVRWFGRLPK